MSLEPLDIRCGILHRAEARRGWRVRRSGPLLDPKVKVINATRFMKELRVAVDRYASTLETDASLAMPAWCSLGS